MAHVERAENMGETVLSSYHVASRNELRLSGLAASAFTRLVILLVP